MKTKKSLKRKKQSKIIKKKFFSNQNMPPNAFINEVNRQRARDYMDYNRQIQLQRETALMRQRQWEQNAANRYATVYLNKLKRLSGPMGYQWNTKAANKYRDAYAKRISTMAGPFGYVGKRKRKKSKKKRYIKK